MRNKMHDFLSLLLFEAKMPCLNSVRAYTPFSFLGIARTSSALHPAIGNPVDLLIDFIIRIRYETL